jgi:hypothetical protein
MVSVEYRSAWHVGTYTHIHTHLENENTQTIVCFRSSRAVEALQGVRPEVMAAIEKAVPQCLNDTQLSMGKYKKVRIQIECVNGHHQTGSAPMPSQHAAQHGQDQTRMHAVSVTLCITQCCVYVGLDYCKHHA